MTSPALPSGAGVWTVEDDQSQLKTDIEQLFNNQQPQGPGFGPAPTDFATARTVNGGHGRIETRTLTTSSWLAETSDWPARSRLSHKEHCMEKSELLAWLQAEYQQFQALLD